MTKRLLAHQSRSTGLIDENESRDDGGENGVGVHAHTTAMTVSSVDVLNQ